MKIYLTLDDPENATLALRAVKWLLDKPATQKDAIIVYGAEGDQKKFTVFVERVKTGISVRQCY